MDQTEESRRLLDLYARMNEGELEVVAREAYDLTDVARPLLKDEIARRGLTIPLVLERPRKGKAPAPDLDLVEIAVYETVEEAQRVKHLLNDAGIPCFWGPNHMDDPDEAALSMQVRSDEAARVRAGLKELTRDETEDVSEFSFACPKCQSPDIVFQDLDATSKFNWSCDACGHQWVDDGVEQA